MEVYQGKSVFGGIAIGRISVHKKDEQQVKRVKIENPDREIARYRQARQTAMEQLQNLYQKALKEVGEANAAIFEIHQMMLEDDDYKESIENIIICSRFLSAFFVIIKNTAFLIILLYQKNSAHSKSPGKYRDFVYSLSSCIY